MENQEKLTKEQFFAHLDNLTVLELVDYIKEFENRYGISAAMAAPVMAAGGAAAGATVAGGAAAGLFGGSAASPMDDANKIPNAPQPAHGPRMCLPPPGITTLAQQCARTPVVDGDARHAVDVPYCGRTAPGGAGIQRRLRGLDTFNVVSMRRHGGSVKAKDAPRGLAMGPAAFQYNMLGSWTAPR